jgi:hypothetical protein
LIVIPDFSRISSLAERAILVHEGETRHKGVILQVKGPKGLVLEPDWVGEFNEGDH